MRDYKNNNMRTNINDLSSRWAQVYYTLYALRRVTSKKEYCNAIGMQPQNFRSIETGTRSVPMSALLGVINAYAVSPEWLFLGSGNMLLE